MRQQEKLHRQRGLSSRTLVYFDTCKESGQGIENFNLRSIDSKYETIDWKGQGWVVGDQSIRARRNGEDTIAGEISHGVTAVLNSLVRVCEGELGAGCKVVILSTKNCQCIINDLLLAVKKGWKVRRLTPAKYSVSHVRSHCAETKTGVSRRHRAFKQVEDSIFDGDISVHGGIRFSMISGVAVG